MVNINENKAKSDFYNLVSNRIRDARIAKGVKQDVLAYKLATSRNSLINIEKGRQYPSLFMIFEIAFHLEISIKELLPEMDEFVKKFTTPNLSSEISVEEEQTMGLTTATDEVLDTVEQFLKSINKNNETEHNQSGE